MIKGICKGVRAMWDERKKNVFTLVNFPDKIYLIKVNKRNTYFEL